MLTIDHFDSVEVPEDSSLWPTEFDCDEEDVLEEYELRDDYAGLYVKRAGKSVHNRTHPRTNLLSRAIRRSLTQLFTHGSA